MTKFIVNTIKPGMTVVDVGTNIGYFTVLLGMLVGNAGKVYGFEANEEIFKTLNINMEMNWVTSQSVLKNNAVYSENTALTFYVSQLFQGSSSLRDITENEDRGDTIQRIEVEAVSLDNALNGVEVIDFMKIDVEEGEYHALLGMTRLLDEGRIRTVVFEWNKIVLGEDENVLANKLKELELTYKAKFNVLDNEGNLVLVPLETIISMDFYPAAVIQF